MSVNLSEIVRSEISHDLVTAVSSFLGENAEGVSKAIEASVPTVLNGILENNSSDPANTSSLIARVKESGILEDLPGLFAGNGNLISKGSALITELFGTRSGIVSSLISSYAGIKPSSATTVLSCVAPMVLGSLGKHSQDMGTDGLTRLLASQREHLEHAIPQGLNFSNIVKDHSITPSPSEERKVSASPPVWALPLLLIVSGAMLIWYFTGKVKKDEPELVSTTTAAEQPPAAKQSMKVELPGGVVLDAFRGGIEDQLVSFLKDSSAEAGKDVWFDFDNLNFAVGTAEISPESLVQVNNITAILKAFPKARIKIGGYTDKTGDESANLTLSKNRADAVRAALTAAGVGDQVTDAEGYGSRFAKVPAEAPESARLADRRVSVSVREK